MGQAGRKDDIARCEVSWDSDIGIARAAGLIADARVFSMSGDWMGGTVRLMSPVWEF